MQSTDVKIRAVASPTVPGGQEFHFPHFSSNFNQFLIFFPFPQTFLIFFLILALRVGELPTREGPGYATGKKISLAKSPRNTYCYATCRLYIYNSDITVTRNNTKSKTKS